jgi:hypothetical protein
LWSLAFPRGGRALAFVRAPLSFVCHQLAVVRHSVALVGDSVSSPKLKFTSSQVCLALGEGIFALIEFASAAPPAPRAARHRFRRPQLTPTPGGPAVDPPRVAWRWPVPGNQRSGQMGVQIPLFQIPQLPAPVGFHIICAPGAQAG